MKRQPNIDQDLDIKLLLDKLPSSDTYLYIHKSAESKDAILGSRGASEAQVNALVWAMEKDETFRQYVFAAMNYRLICNPAEEAWFIDKLKEVHEKLSS